VEVVVPLQEDRILLDRYRVGAVAPAQDGRIWAHAVDRATDTALTLETVGRAARLRPGGSERRTNGVAAPPHPAVASSTDLGEVAGVQVTAWEGVITPWPKGARLGPADITRALIWLAPGVVAAADALGGELDARDLVLDPSGVPRIAPSGVVREESLARPPHHRPPTPSSAADDALYGLGIVLFEAATGHRPTTARTASQLSRAQLVPLRAASLRTDLPGSVAGALDALVSPDPAARRALLAVLPEASPPPLTFLTAPEAPSASAQDAAHAVARTSATVPERALAGWLVVAHAATATQAARRRLAALGELSPDAVEASAAAAEEIPVRDRLRSEADAKRAATALAHAGVPLDVRLVPDAPTGRYVAAAGLGGAGMLGALAVLAMLPFGLGFALAAALPAAALLSAGALLATRARHDGALLARLQAAARRQDEAPPLTGAAAEIQSARRAALNADLPEPALHDLLDAADGLDEALGHADAQGAETLVSAAQALTQAATSQAAEHDTAVKRKEAEGRAHAAASALRATRR
jgi:hypothetical protein